MAQRTCAADGCEKRLTGRGDLCKKHYDEARARPATCTVDGCEKACLAKGLCAMHRHRVQAFGDTDLPPQKTCINPGCDEPVGSRAKHGKCRKCYNRETQRERVAQNRDSINAKKRAFYQENREKVLAQQAAWRARDPEVRAQARRRAAEWKARNPEKYRTGLDRRNAQNALDPEPNRARVKAWRNSMWEKHLADGRARMALIRKDLDASYAERGLRDCWMCGGGYTDENQRNHDHLIPRSLGGPDETWNVAPACRTCNVRRSNTPLAQTVARHYPDGIPDGPVADAIRVALAREKEIAHD